MRFNIARAVGLKELSPLFRIGLTEESLPI
jgi:hypothetical protein